MLDGGGDMPKTIYGQGKANSSLRKREFAVSESDHNEWLTLLPACEGSPAEESRLRKMMAALREFLPAEAEAEALDASVAATIVDYAERVDGGCDSADAWASVVCEVFEDLGVTLEADEAEVVGALRKSGALVKRPPPLPPPRAGDPVLAVLEEDGEWHAAVIAEEDVEGSQTPPTPSGTGAQCAGCMVVRFVQWPKQQLTKRQHVVPLGAAVTPEDEQGGGEGGEGGSRGGEGTCELCERRMALTFHHLVPKATHCRYIGRALPEGLPETASATKSFFGQYGVRICSACHAVVHRHAPNAVLAAKFNTLERLMEAPSIAKWVEYAGRRG